MDKPQPGDAEKAAAFLRAMDRPVERIACRLCAHPMRCKKCGQGTESGCDLYQCVNPKCLWRDTTLADQTNIERLPLQATSEDGNDG